MKRMLKEFLLRLWAFLCPSSCPKVVFYHDIGKHWTAMGTDCEVFWQHMKCLRHGDVVCFDDGFRGIWDEREKWRSEGVMGRGSDGVKKIVFLAVELVGRPGYLKWDEIRELQDKYGFEFQCHTWSHQTLAGPWNDEVPAPVEGRTEEWYRHELVASKCELKRQLGRAVTALCLPVGHFSDSVIGRCRAAGYKKVYASYPGNVTNDYVQPRCIAQDLSVAAFKAVLNGGMTAFKNRYREMHEFKD